MKKIAVVGSCSADYVVNTDVIPQEGETVFGESFQLFFGGKGANQAVAASRLGAEVSMVGAVGTDAVGPDVLANLKDNGIDTTHMREIDDQSTGVAHIIVKDGDNRIIIVPGANYDVSAEQVAAAGDLLKACDLVIMQQEVPSEVNRAVIDFCDEHGIDTILDPAPARFIPDEWAEKITYLIPNETECKQLFPELTIEEALSAHPNRLIVTLGEHGAAFHNGTEIIRVPAHLVEPVDTTGAGDTFSGALAVGLAHELGLEEAIRFANLASSLAVQVPGAQDGIPTIEQMAAEEAYDADKWLTAD